MRKFSFTLGLATLGAKLARSSLATRIPRLGLDERLAMLPRTIDGLDGDVTIHWNQHHVPFVRATTDADLGAGFGLVHAHLRLTQMEIMRRAAYGRLAEVFGSAAVEIDYLLRLIDFPRATEASLKMLPAATRAWVDRYAAGINAVCAERNSLPPEFRILDFEPAPWTAQDVFAVSRLASADYTWKVWRSLNQLRGEPDWATLWAELIGHVAVADEDVPVDVETLSESMPTMFARDGSNAAAVAASRSASGSPLIACDPHLMITIPCVWLIVGLRSPTFHLAGLTIPGLPIVGVGRNPEAGWGGTNLHATSSELVDVTREEAELTVREVAVNVRWSRPRPLRLRESRFGPVLSDAKPFRSGRAETVALKWMGHEPSDEFTPFLDMMRAKRWDDFVEALGRYSLPGLNMLYAGKDGRIGQMVAARVPRRPLHVPDDIVVSPQTVEREWSDLVDGRELPMVVDPADGILASANNSPTDSDVAIGHFFSTDHRVERWREMLAALTDASAADLAACQEDVFYAPALEVRDQIAALFENVTDVPPAGRPSWTALLAWDGHYAERSEGALAFELIANALIAQLEKTSPKRSLIAHWSPFFRLTRLIELAADEDLRAGVEAAVDAAEKPFAEFRRWGRMHEIRLVHPIGRLPWFRRIAQVARFPSGGSNETVMKTMHPYTDRKHATHFGQNARFVADLGDADANDFLLLGGQDGWLGSATIGDQVRLWREGRMIRVPLTLAAVDRAFPKVTRIGPATAAAAAAGASHAA